jgi:hypothetical protein
LDAFSRLQLALLGFDTADGRTAPVAGPVDRDHSDGVLPRQCSSHHDRFLGQVGTEANRCTAVDRDVVVSDAASRLGRILPRDANPAVDDRGGEPWRFRRDRVGPREPEARTGPRRV